MAAEKTATSSRNGKESGGELVARATRGLIRLQRRRRRRAALRRLLVLMICVGIAAGAAYGLADRAPAIDWQHYLQRLPLRSAP